MHIKKSVFIFSAVFIMAFSTAAFARPVSYPGGWTVMTMNDYFMNSLHVHYSPTAKYSVGYKVAYWPGKKFQTHTLQVNNLLKRWNNYDSQANLYLKTGAGLAYEPDGNYADDVEPHGHSGLFIDWENRRFFTQYGNTYYYSGDIGKEYRQFIKVGITPYIGEYGDLHTWLMLKVDHAPDDADEVVLTPMVRFFKGEYLLEVGYSDNDEVLCNFVVRF